MKKLICLYVVFCSNKNCDFRKTPTKTNGFWTLLTVASFKFRRQVNTFWNKNDANFGRDFWSILLDCLVAFGPFWEPKLLQNRCSFLSEFWYQNLVYGWSVLVPVWAPFWAPFQHLGGSGDHLGPTVTLNDVPRPYRDSKLTYFGSQWHHFRRSITPFRSNSGSTFACSSIIVSVLTCYR